MQFVAAISQEKGSVWSLCAISLSQLLLERWCVDRICVFLTSARWMEHSLFSCREIGCDWLYSWQEPFLIVISLYKARCRGKVSPYPMMKNTRSHLMGQWGGLEERAGVSRRHPHRHLRFVQFTCTSSGLTVGLSFHSNIWSVLINAGSKIILSGSVHKILVANSWLYGNTSYVWYVHQVFILKPHYWTAMSYPEWIFFKHITSIEYPTSVRGGIWSVECVGRWFEHSGFYWFYIFLCFSWLFFDIVRVWFTGVEALSCVTSDEPHAFNLPFFINKVLYICTIDCSWPSDYLPFLRHLFVLIFCSST